MATADGQGLGANDLAALTRIFDAGLTGLAPSDPAHIPVLLRRLGWHAWLPVLPRAALHALTQRANECDDYAVLGTPGHDAGPVAPLAAARELYASDVAQRFVIDSCNRARGPAFFAARSPLGPGDDRFDVPQPTSVRQNFAPHIARLALFLARIAALQSGGEGGGLPSGVPPLAPPLKVAVDAFVTACADDLPDQWAGFCTAAGRPPPTDARLRVLRDVRGHLAPFDKLQAVFSLLYLTTWRL